MPKHKQPFLIYKSNNFALYRCTNSGDWMVCDCGRISYVESDYAAQLALEHGAKINFLKQIDDFKEYF